MSARASLGEEVAAEQEATELRALVQRLQRRVAKAEAKTADLVAAVYQGAKDAALLVGLPQPISRPPRDRRKGAEVALLVLADWQLGKRTESYDPDVCEERIRRAVAKTIRLAEIARADHPVREIVVALSGDLVEGVTIFPGQAWEVSATAFEQVFRASALVEQVIVSLLGEFESVTVHEVSGNHGRIGKRGDHPKEDNLDRIVGRVARERLAGQPRLTWHEPSGWYSIIEIGTYRALLVHGDQVKSFGGNVPAFGILRKANAWAAGGVKERFRDVYMGHFHQEMTLTMASGGRVYVTPSPESDNAYAAEFVAARGEPGQRLHFIDPDAGRVTAPLVLWLE